MKVICLWAGPGAGKSTTAAGTFFEMKHLGLKVELVTEVAKDLTYEARLRTLENQLYILGKQERNIRRLQGHVDWVVTDSPLLLGTMYAAGVDAGPVYQQTALNYFLNYDNINFFIDRTKPYMQYGRSQTADEAKVIDGRIVQMLQLHRLNYSRVDGDYEAPKNICRALGLM